MYGKLFYDTLVSTLCDAVKVFLFLLSIAFFWRKTIIESQKMNMKKTATFLMAMVAGHLAMAQTQLPNSNFEDWAIAANGRDSLVGWSSSNTVVINPVRSLYKGTDHFQGQYAATISTAPFGFVQYTTIGVLVNGDASFSYGGGGGGANVAYEAGGGTPISIKPSELRGYYKYTTGSASDQGTARVLLTRYNTTTNKRDTVSNSTYIFASQSTYAPFTINLTDIMPGTMPDTITTIFSSSNAATVANNGVFSELLLDSISLYKDPTPPVADFTSNVTTGTVNTTLFNFTDLSTNTPTSWGWTFAPNTVAYQSGTTATSTNPIVKFTATGTYNVTLNVTNADGSNAATKTGYITVTSNNTGITERGILASTSLYPNPAKDKVYIDQQLLGADIKISDLCGKTLINISNQKSKVIDVTTLPDGLYFINFYKEGISQSGKLLIRK